MVNKMTPIFSEKWDGEDTKKTIKAPSGTYYKINNIIFSSNIAIDGYLILTSEPVEDLDFAPDNILAIANFTCNQKQSQNIQFLNGVITKYITLIFDRTGSFEVMISIAYELVNATKANLIYDFVKRYR